jgi:hypothetical protein
MASSSWRVFIREDRWALRYLLRGLSNTDTDDLTSQFDSNILSSHTLNDLSLEHAFTTKSKSLINHSNIQ